MTRHPRTAPAVRLLPLALAAIARGRTDGTVIGTTNMPGLLTIPIQRTAQSKLDDFAPI
eukprot:gene20265-24843_t